MPSGDSYHTLWSDRILCHCRYMLEIHWSVHLFLMTILSFPVLWAIIQYIQTLYGQNHLLRQQLDLLGCDFAPLHAQGFFKRLFICYRAHTWRLKIRHLTALGILCVVRCDYFNTEDHKIKILFHHEPWNKISETEVSCDYMGSNTKTKFHYYIFGYAPVFSKWLKRGRWKGATSSKQKICSGNYFIPLLYKKNSLLFS